jgi:2-haloalkanoic acid dehalogenase type II
MTSSVTTRAVLFDFGGTLYDYGKLQAGEAESLMELARAAGIAAEPTAVFRAHREALKKVFYGYLPRRYYLHRDLFRDAVAEMVQSFGIEPRAQHLDVYRTSQWERHGRDFVLRDGVHDTLKMLRARGLHIGMVSNIDEDQLTHLLALGQLAPYFDSLLSSEAAGSCKPDPAIFHEALRRAGCRPAEALFVGDTIQQDIAGANRVGMRSALIWHRHDREPPDGEPRPTHVIRSIPEILDLV